MGLETFFIARHDVLVDNYNRATFMSWSVLSWCQIIIGGLSAAVAISTSAWALFSDKAFESPETTAVAVMYSFLTPYYMAFVVQIVTTVWMYMTSYERVNEYNEHNLPQEPPFKLEGDAPFQHGAIQFDNASLRYRPGLPLAVKSLSLTIPPGTKVGVAGRTGAGKSTLVAMLFRLHDIEADGTIKLDGRDIHSVGLQSLREAITVIPQDPSASVPVCFRCGMRFRIWSVRSTAEKLSVLMLIKANLEDASQRSINVGRVSAVALLCRSIAPVSLEIPCVEYQIHADVLVLTSLC